MEFKRNFSSNMQSNQGKSSPLIQPILNIAKASTPVRTRVVKGGSQMNSTPVNIHKIGNLTKSPTISNKENDNQNHIQFEIKKPKITQKNINLSPVLALNRKLTEGPNIDIRSLTPSGFKRQQSLADILRDSRNTPANEYQMRSSKAFPPNLQQRTSNSFKKLIQSRAQTPTQNSNKKLNQSGFLRSSGSAQSLLSGMKKLKESKFQKMSQSRSFDQLLSLRSSKVKEDDILCSNEHKQKLLAKYRVVKMNDYEEDDEEMLVYCSKCAIGLVNQNFKVQELTKDEKNFIKMKRMYCSEPNKPINNKYAKYVDSLKKSIEDKLKQVKQQKSRGCREYASDIQQIDSYYNSIIAMIEEQRVKDRQKIIKTRDQKKSMIQELEQELHEAIYHVNAVINNRTYSNDQLLSIQRYEGFAEEVCEFPKKSIQIFDAIEEKFEYFGQILENTVKLNIGNQNNRFPVEKFDQKVPADSALRFSFEKMLKMKQKNQMNKYQSGMNPLEEAEEYMEAQESMDYVDDDYEQKKAFRTLFPEQQAEEQKNDLHSPTFKQF